MFMQLSMHKSVQIDGALVSGIESAPEGTLKPHLRLHVAIYIKTYKKVQEDLSCT